MIIVAVYLILLFINPQVWLGPFVGLPVDYLIYPLWLIYIVLSGRHLEFIRFRSQDWFFVGYVIWNFVTLLANDQLDAESLKMCVDYAKWFVLYRCTAATVAGPDGVRRACKLLVFFGLVLAAEGIQHFWSESGLGWAGQTFGWVNEAAVTQIGLDKRTRWVAIFDGPGVFCVVYTIAQPFLLQYMVKPFSWATRFVAALLLVCLLLAIFYTGSRGGYVTAFFIMGAFAVRRIGLSVPKLAIVGGLCFVLIMAAPSYLTSTRDSSGSAQNRIVMWAYGIEMLRYNPLFGIGRAQFKHYTGSLIAHNSAIEIMGEAGLPGLFLWIGIVYMGFKNIARVLRDSLDSTECAYASALGLCIAGYVVSSMFVTLEYETFYFLLALSSAAAARLEDPPRFTHYDAMAIVGMIAVFVSILKVYVMSYF